MLSRVRISINEKNWGTLVNGVDFKELCNWWEEGETYVWGEWDIFILTLFCVVVGCFET